MRKRLEEHTAYIGAFFYILFKLQIRDFERSNDPLGEATATADQVRRALLNSNGSEDDPMLSIVVDFFDQIVEDIRSRCAEGKVGEEQ